jgi:hypothetical protein
MAVTDACAMFNRSAMAEVLAAESLRCSANLKMALR